MNPPEDAYVAGATTGPGRLDRRMAANATWSLAGQASVLAAGLAVVAVVSRFLGSESLGIWRYAQAIAALLIVVGDAGLSAMAARDIARQGHVPGRYGWPVVATRLSVSVPLVATALLTVSMFDSAGSAVLVAVVSLTAIAMAATVTYAFQGIEDLGSVSRLRIVTQIVAALVAIAGAVWLHSIFIVACAFVVSAFVNAGVMLWWAARRGLLRRSPWTPAIAVTLVRGGAPFFGSAVAIQVVLNGGSLILGATHGAAELGLFAAPYAVASYLLLLGGALMTAAYPRLAAHAPAGGSFETLASDLCAVMGAIAIPVFVGGVLLSDQLVVLLFGAAYAGEGGLFAVLLTMPLLAYFSMTLGQAANARGSERAAAVVALVVAAVSLFLGVILILPLGRVGASVAVVLTEVATIVGYAFVMRHVGPGRLIANYLSSVPAAVIMGAAVVVTRTAGAPVLASVAVGIGVYGALGMAGLSGGFRLLRGIMREDDR